jgi:hypothetical protein
MALQLSPAQLIESNVPPPFNSWLALPHVSCNGSISDQKTSKFFVFQVEESMAGHVGVNKVY